MKLLSAKAILLLGLALAAGADQVRLKNGHVMEGVLVEESPDAVILRIAGGSISLKPSSIASMTRSGAEKNAALQADWRGQRFLDKDNVPPGLEPLAAQCRSLDSLRLRAGGGQNLQAVSDYRAGIQVCSQMLTAAEAAWNPASQTAPALFLKRVREQVTQAYSHFHQASLQPERRGNAFLIPVLINGRTEARFILDTGAEITTITKALAERAGIPATGRLAPVGMADGTRLDAPVVRLDSLRFGHFDTPGVEAVMLPNPPDEGVDGLLGMNVLGSFLIRFDPARGLFELEQFNSK